MIRSRLRIAVLLSLVCSVVLLATTDSDPFTYSDGDLGTVSSSAWVNMSGSDELVVVSGHVEADATPVYGELSYRSGTWGDDQYSQFTLVSAPTGSSRYAVIGVRANGTAGSTGTGYFAWFDEGSLCAIYEMAAGSFGSSLTTCSGYPAAGSVMKLNISGSTITLYDDGAPIASTSDGTVTSGSPAIGGYGLSSTPVQIDDWSASDEGGEEPPPSGTHKRRKLMGVGDLLATLLQPTAATR